MIKENDLLIELNNETYSIDFEYIQDEFNLYSLNIKNVSLFDELTNEYKALKIDNKLINQVEDLIINKMQYDKENSCGE